MTDRRDQSAPQAQSQQQSNDSPQPDCAGAHQTPQIPPPTPEQMRRRKFLTILTLGLGGTSALSVVWAIVGYVVAPVTGKMQQVWRKVGGVDDFLIGATKVVTFENADTVPWAGYAGRTAAYLRRDAKDAFVCFSLNCTHLGCPVRWEEGSQLFMCPCHGGVYYKDGEVAAGPPPKPLPRYQVRINGNDVEVLATAIPITKGM
jgi:menaquinol-cytochrome c reductase iron-sulfur subunit